MKSNKGFTLVELLGVIIVLGIIAAISYPSIEQMLQNSKQKMYDNQIVLLENALEQYAVANRKSLPTGDGEYKRVTLRELVEGGFVDEGLENPLTGEPFKESELNMVITRYHKNYTYHVND